MNAFGKIVTVLLFASSFVRGDTIVVPPGNTTQSGDSSLSFGFKTPYDWEVAFTAKNFSNPVQITGLSFRQDEGTGQGGSFEAVIPKACHELFAKIVCTM
jgi:hypothetical protein